LGLDNSAIIEGDSFFLLGCAFMKESPLMPSEALVEIIDLLEGEAIDVWLDGGWGIDALLEHQTRLHADVDIIVRVTDVPLVQTLIEERGFTIKEGMPPNSFVLADDTGLEVDIHAVRFDEEGNGIYRMQNGDDWIYPQEGFLGKGKVSGKKVNCLSAPIQVLCHAHGYTPVQKDFDDMKKLEEKFGVELPPHLVG
jgi:lincosamide nucleotidyltransferase A/C/D/E